MKKVTYRGTATSAVITSADFEAAGVKSADVEFSGYGDVQEVANDAADLLAERDARFEVEGSSDSAYSRRLAADPTEQLRRVRTGEPVSPDMLAQTTEQERRAVKQAAASSSKGEGESA